MAVRHCFSRGEMSSTLVGQKEEKKMLSSTPSDATRQSLCAVAMSGMAI